MTKPSLTEIISDCSHPLEPLETQTSPIVPQLRNIKAVLFDVYGTLMVSGVGDISHSSEDNRTLAITEVFKEMNIPLKDQHEALGDEFFRIVKEQQSVSRENGINYPEIDIREVWTQFIQENGRINSTVSPLDPMIAELAIRFELRVNKTWPMPSLESTLRALKNKNVKLGIVSNAQFFTPLLFQAYNKQSVKELGFETDLCQWSYEYKEAKPSTKMYRTNAVKLEAKYGIQPHEVLYVGNDMLNDVLPAYQCGFKTALFAGDKRSLRLRNTDKRLEGIKPDLIITNLDQILTSIF